MDLRKHSLLIKAVGLKEKGPARNGMSVKLITHKNGIQEIIGIRILDESLEWFARFTEIVAFPSADARSSSAKGKEDDSSASKQLGEI